MGHVFLVVTADACSHRRCTAATCQPRDNDISLTYHELPTKVPDIPETNQSRQPATKSKQCEKSKDGGAAATKRAGGAAATRSSPGGTAAAVAATSGVVPGFPGGLDSPAARMSPPPGGWASRGWGAGPEP